MTINFISSDSLKSEEATILRKIYPISTLYSWLHLPDVKSPQFQIELINGIEQLKKSFMAEVEKKQMVGVDTPELEMYIELRQRVLPAEATGGELVKVEKGCEYLQRAAPLRRYTCLL